MGRVRGRKGEVGKRCNYFREKKDLLWKVLVRNQRDNVKKRSVQI